MEWFSGRDRQGQTSRLISFYVQRHLARKVQLPLIRGFNPYHLHQKITLPTWQNDSSLPHDLSFKCLSKSPRSDCFWVRPPVAHTEGICDWVSPLLTVQNYRFLMRNRFSPPRGFVQTSLKVSGVWRFTIKYYRIFIINVKKKINYFHFFC